MLDVLAVLGEFGASEKVRNHNRSRFPRPWHIRLAGVVWLSSALAESGQAQPLGLRNMFGTIRVALWRA